MWRRLIEAPIRRVGYVEGSPISRARGRIRKTTGKTIKDLELEVNLSMIHSRMFWVLALFDPCS